MSKKKYCTNNPATAYYGGFGGLEIHGIEYGIEDYLYCVSGAWGKKSERKFHKLKVYYDTEYSYVHLYGQKILLNECLRIA